MYWESTKNRMISIGWFSTCMQLIYVDWSRLYILSVPVLPQIYMNIHLLNINLLINIHMLTYCTMYNIACMYLDNSGGYYTFYLTMSTLRVVFIAFLYCTKHFPQIFRDISWLCVQLPDSFPDDTNKGIRLICFPNNNVQPHVKPTLDTPNLSKP